jgi:ABC-type glycerol-3-phosphate transport system permease component
MWTHNAGNHFPARVEFVPVAAHGHPDRGVAPAMVGTDYLQRKSTPWGQIMAYASIVTVPVLAMFIAFQKAFISSTAASGVKG